MPDERNENADRAVLNQEFERAAKVFAERTKGRFDELGPVAFSCVQSDETVLEVGAGTGNFLNLFAGSTRRLIALDLTFGMLQQARERHEGLALVLGDGAKLPFASGSIDLVASAQALHHIWKPVPVVMEMRRVAGPDGRVLIVDQHSTENYEQTAFMNQLEVIRDPSHAMSRPPSAFRIIVQNAGLEIVDEHLHEQPNRLSQWMWPGEYPEERIAAVCDFIEKFGHEAGMNFERDGDDYVFTRRRIMLLARRSISRV